MMIYVYKILELNRTGSLCHIKKCCELSGFLTACIVKNGE
jgi:hypothetical protein